MRNQYQILFLKDGKLEVTETFDKIPEGLLKTLRSLNCAPELYRRDVTFGPWEIQPVKE